MAVEAVVNGAASLTEFRDRPGAIDAWILEEDGRVVMRKTCVEHGTFEDVLSTVRDVWPEAPSTIAPLLCRRETGRDVGRG